ncbi:MAG TPA: dihydroorotase [Gammaproteobacteria bacterium]|nr:dihydroorotase [Gammaproteobacteria bacterium]
MQKITLIKPDDAHLHLRDGTYLQTTVPHAAKQFARAVIMPNLKPPVVTMSQVLAYRERIIAAIPRGLSFQPLMTLYLTDAMTPQIVAEAKASGIVIGVKLYPAGVTTHSEAGVNRLEQVYPALEAMQEQDLPLLIHGESNDAQVDIFDREKYFLEQLQQLIERFPGLRVVLEHITTEEAVRFVTMASTSKLAATITAHHLLLNRNDLLSGGIKPHYYCLPVLKRQRHQLALIAAATSGNPRFFLGTDSAPHAKSTKENACGCAGIYSAHAALEFYAQVFERAGVLDRLQGFASHFAADFYGLSHNSETVTLIKKPWRVPNTLPFGEDVLVPLGAGEMVQWQVV